MQSQRTIELGTGLFVLLGFAAFFFLITQITNREISWGDPGYRLKARFDNIGGLKPGAPVAMSGVTVGRVEAIEYDSQEYKAVVTLRINPKYDQIPDDSDAAIFTAGLLGGQYLGITPGGSETFFKDGSQIDFTQSAIVLENLISKFLFSIANRQADDKTGTAPAPAAATPAAAP